MMTVSGLELEIEGNSFQGGKAKLTCIASLFNLYKREREVVLEEERPRPRPSSVLGTRDASAGMFTNKVKILSTYLNAGKLTTHDFIDQS